MGYQEGDYPAGEQLEFENVSFVGCDGLPICLSIEEITAIEAEGYQIPTATHVLPGSGERPRQKLIETEAIRVTLGRMFISLAHNLYNLTGAAAYLPSEFKKKDLPVNLEQLFKTWPEGKIENAARILSGLPEMKIGEEPFTLIDYVNLAGQLTDEALGNLNKEPSREGFPLPLIISPEIKAHLPELEHLKAEWKNQGYASAMERFASVCYGLPLGKPVSPWERRNICFGINVVLLIDTQKAGKDKRGIKLALPFQLHSVHLRKEDFTVASFKSSLLASTTSILAFSFESKAIRPTTIIDSKFLPYLAIIAGQKLTPSSLQPDKTPILKVTENDLKQFHAQRTTKGESVSHSCILREFPFQGGKLEATRYRQVISADEGSQTQELLNQLKGL